MVDFSILTTSVRAGPSGMEWTVIGRKRETLEICVLTLFLLPFLLLLLSKINDLPSACFWLLRAVTCTVVRIVLVSFKRCDDSRLFLPFVAYY